MKMERLTICKREMAPMKLVEKWRTYRLRTEPVIYFPIRLDYSCKAYRMMLAPYNPEKMVEAYPYFRENMSGFLLSVFGPSNIVSDRPATIIDVAETHSPSGFYGTGGYTHGSAKDIELCIRILCSSDSGHVFLDPTQRRIVRNGEETFRIPPPPSITIYPRQPQYVGDVKGDFPNQKIETWLRSFSCRKAE